jgi:hypothetical protein
LTLFAGFTPSATGTVVRAGRLAAETGAPRLRTDFLLLALAEDGHLNPPLDALAGRGGAVRGHIPEYVSGRTDRELLALLGIDLDEVRRIAEASTGLRLDDARLWRLQRSRLRRLRYTLRGPAGELRLDGRSRKVVEVARYWARRRGTPVGPEHLLWGLLADGSNESVRVLRRIGVDLPRLGESLQRWYGGPAGVR